MTNKYDSSKPSTNYIPPHPNESASHLFGSAATDSSNYKSSPIQPVQTIQPPEPKYKSITLYVPPIPDSSLSEWQRSERKNPNSQQYVPYPDIVVSLDTHNAAMSAWNRSSGGLNDRHRWNDTLQAAIGTHLEEQGPQILTQLVDGLVRERLHTFKAKLYFDGLAVDDINIFIGHHAEHLFCLLGSETNMADILKWATESIKAGVHKTTRLKKGA